MTDKARTKVEHIHNVDGLSVNELRDRVISHTTHLGLVSALMCSASTSALLTRRYAVRQPLPLSCLLVSACERVACTRASVLEFAAPLCISCMGACASVLRRAESRRHRHNYLSPLPLLLLLHAPLPRLPQLYRGVHRSRGQPSSKNDGSLHTPPFYLHLLLPRPLPTPVISNGC